MKRIVTKHIKALRKILEVRKEALKEYHRPDQVKQLQDGIDALEYAIGAIESQEECK